jgi:hypothetical protein
MIAAQEDEQILPAQDALGGRQRSPVSSRPIDGSDDLHPVGSDAAGSRGDGVPLVPHDDHDALEIVCQEGSDGPLDQGQPAQAEKELRPAPGVPAEAF